MLDEGIIKKVPAKRSSFQTSPRQTQDANFIQISIMSLMKSLFFFLFTVVSLTTAIIQTGDVVDVDGRSYVKTAWITANGSEMIRLFFIRPTVDGNIVVNGKRVTQGNVYACVGPDVGTCDLDGYEYVPELADTGYATLSVETEVTTVWVKRYETYLYGKALEVN